MVIKPYEESKKLQFFRILYTRYEPNEEQKQYYESLIKGDEGERQFAELLKKVKNGSLIIHDLLLEEQNSSFQSDAFLVSQKTLHLFEVKNFFGDYYIESGNWYTSSGKEIQNPLSQLRRSIILLLEFMKKNGFNFQIQGSIIFVNPEFTLYQAPRNLPIVFPTQLNRLIHQLNQNPFKPGKYHLSLANALVKNDLEEDFSDKIPKYQYDSLKKGIDCGMCRSLNTSVVYSNLLCLDCQNREKVDSAILRCIKHFQLLFHQKKITVQLMEDWCGKMVSAKTIRRILSKHYKLNGFGRSAHYIGPSL